MLLMASIIACAGQPQPSPRDVADANDTGGRLAPSSEADRSLLRQLPNLPSGAPQRIGSASVVAEPAYAAASGQTCRALHMTVANSAARHRLACSDGTTWFFVPDVFGSNSSD